MTFPRALFLTAVTLTAVALAVTCLFGVWMYFCTADLPDVSQLRAFVPPIPATVTIVTDGRSVHSIALPLSSIGHNMRNAVLAAEGDLDPRSLIRRYYDEIVARRSGRRYGLYSFQLARMLPHDMHAGLKWQLWWIRMAIQIERRFTQEEILTIYMNRMYFGEDLYGVNAAALRYFKAPSAQLTPA